MPAGSKTINFKIKNVSPLGRVAEAEASLTAKFQDGTLHCNRAPINQINLSNITNLRLSIGSDGKGGKSVV